MNGSAKLRVALIGLGGVAERIHLPALAGLPQCELVGACEIDPDRRARMAAQFKIPATYPDAERLLAEQPADLAIVGTPPVSHRDLCLLSFERGCHVFCEKPFVSDVQEADEVLAAAKGAGRAIAVNNQYRFMRIYEDAKTRLEAGEFGRLFLLQSWQQMMHPPSKEKNWRAHLVQSTLYEFGTHALDLICYFFGALPLTISAQIPHPRPDIEADVVVLVTLRFPGERVATMVLNRISQAPERYLEMRLDCERASLRLSLGGVARASLDWSKAAGRPILRTSFVRGGEARVEANGRSRVIAQERDKAFASATARNLDAFTRAIQSGADTTGAAWHARELIRLVFAGYESARTGRTVEFSPLAVTS
jgi:predicted dehydrogenase